MILTVIIGLLLISTVICWFKKINYEEICTLKKTSLKPGYITVEGIKVYIYPFSKANDSNLSIVPI